MVQSRNHFKRSPAFHSSFVSFFARNLATRGFAFLTSSTLVIFAQTLFMLYSSLLQQGLKLILKTFYPAMQILKHT
jgi:hypothetical protein